MSEDSWAEFQGIEQPVCADFSIGKKRYLVQHRNGQTFSISPAALYIIRELRSGAPSEVLSKQIESQYAITAAEAETKIKAVEKRFRDSIAISRERDWREQRSRSFWAVRELVSETCTSAVALLGRRLFHPAVMMPALCMICITIFSARPWNAGAATNLMTGVYAYLVFLISIFIHEFGHASASAWFGVKPGGIGFTMYLIYPAFYADVSRCWTLPRWQRVVIDFAGCYYQLLLYAVLTVANLFLHTNFIYLAARMIAVSCLVSLNPIFKCDGYWILADALGVPALGQYPVQQVRRGFDRLRGRPHGDWFQVSAPLKAALTLYSVVWLYFWGRLVVVLCGSVYRGLLHVSTASHHLLGEPGRFLVAATRWSSLAMLYSTALAFFYAVRLCWSFKPARTNR